MLSEPSNEPLLKPQKSKPVGLKINQSY